MKYIFLVFFLLIFTTIDAQVNCQDIITQLKQEISQLKQEASELRRTKESLGRQNNELQTALIICQNKSKPDGDNSKLDDCPPTFGEENKELKKQIQSLTQDNNDKNERLSETNQIFTQLNIELKELSILNSNNIIELKRVNADLENQKDKFKALEKECEDSSKVLIHIKKEKQIYFDSLYTSIDFEKKIIHTDVKLSGSKDSKIGDILLEIPYNIIQSPDWSQNNIDYKLKRIAALYLKYKDKLRIQLISAPIDTEDERKLVNAVILKTMGRFNTYANAVSKTKIALENVKDFDIVLNNQGKKSFVRITLVVKE